jgi:hypothetical protein
MVGGFFTQVLHARGPRAEWHYVDRNVWGWLPRTRQPMRLQHSKMCTTAARQPVLYKREKRVIITSTKLYIQFFHWTLYPSIIINIPNPTANTIHFIPTNAPVWNANYAFLYFIQEMLKLSS